MNLSRFTIRLCCTVMCCLFSSAFIKAFPQTDSLFRLNKNDRLLQLWRNAESDLFLSTDSVRVFRYLNNVEEQAGRQNDNRIVWYCRYFKLLYNGRKFHNVKKEIDWMLQMDNWVNRCPLKIIKASYQHLLGQLYFVDNQFGKAFELQLNAHKYFLETGYDNIPEIGFYLTFLGSNYYQFEDYEKCIEYLQQVEKYPSFFARNNISSLNTLGLVFQKKKEYGRAREKFKASIKMAEAKNDSVWVGIASGNYGNTLMMEGAYAQAIPYLLTDYNTNRFSEPNNTSITAVYLAKAYLNTGNTQQARAFLNEGLRLQGNITKEEEKNSPAFYRHYYEISARYYRAINNMPLAYAYIDSCMKLKDSLKILFNAQQVKTAEHRIASEKYLAGLALAEKEKQSAVWKRNIIIAAILGGILFLFVLLRGQVQKMKREKKLHEQKEALILAENRAVQEKLAHAEVQLTDYIRSLTEKNELIDKIREELSQSQTGIKNEAGNEQLQKINELMRFSILTEDDWQKFKTLFEKVHPHFFVQLRNRYPGISPAETRLLALMKLHLNPREMSYMLGISADSITKLKYRLRKKITELNMDITLEGLVAE